MKSFSGIVIEGKKLWRTINFPTANIRINASDIDPATYGVSVLLENQSYFGIGVHLENSDTFEVHILDFWQDIYGETITITPLIRIRENQKFPSIDDLKKQIEKDREVMQKWINDNK